MLCPEHHVPPFEHPGGTMATLGDVRKFMEGAADKLSPTKAQELAKGMMQGQGREQIQKAAQEILEWSSKNRERVAEVVRREVSAQMKNLGVASKDEVDALKKRVRELERSGTPKAQAKKKPVAKRASARAASSS
jgi:DnaJ-domain-containing protein 1